MPKSITISVPGTSANLGPGFDILGLALKVYNEFKFYFDPSIGYSATLKNGQALPFSESDDLVYSAYKNYFKIFLPNISYPTYQCKMELDLPMKGGLGSSASAVVAGFCLAREIHKDLYANQPIPSEARFLYELAMLEGHPDNTSPAYLGGFVLSYFDKRGHISYYKKKFPNSVAIFALTPNTEVSTHESRKVLPSTYSVDDVIFNMTRIATWIQFFETRRFSDLQLALQDRVHTPYRVPHISGLREIIAIAERKQMATCLSGSGPTLLIFMERKKVKSLEKAFGLEVAEVMKNLGVSYKLSRMQTDTIGVKIVKQR
ncbi:homoserine kinase [Leptospira sp. GIMC2001]|uniref:homoserine kinase n=1 Tax=Leptospira sp. GIMC2001 TaxID=1513297 RepID=UPI003FA544A9